MRIMRFVTDECNPFCLHRRTKSGAGPCAACTLTRSSVIIPMDDLERICARIQEPQGCETPVRRSLHSDQDDRAREDGSYVGEDIIVEILRGAGRESTRRPG